MLIKSIRKGNTVHISRHMLSDGYNYYLMLIKREEMFGTEYIADIRLPEIKSLKKALVVAEELLGSVK